MFSLCVVAVGSLKRSYWKEAAADYLKRLSGYARLQVVEVPEVPFRDARDAARVQKHEAEHLMARIPHGSYRIALDSGGKRFSSETFARHLADQGEGGRTICFLIGGPLGLSRELVQSCDLSLSLGTLTLTHQLARIVLLEQLYRATTILHNKTYHY